MTYQHSPGFAQAAGEAWNADARTRLAEANINPSTGLASDYLNHFHEAIMLLDMLPDCPECLADFLNWKPMSYRQHFIISHFKGRELALAAYDAADPAVRDRLDGLAESMTARLEATRAALHAGLPAAAAAMLAARTAAWLKPVVARAGAVINGVPGQAPDGHAQSVIDGLMRR